MNAQIAGRSASLGLLLAMALLVLGPVQAVAAAVDDNAPGTTAGSAQDPVPGQAQGVAWSQLSGDQQRVLSRFADKWNDLPQQRQQALARGSQKWLSMSP